MQRKTGSRRRIGVACTLKPADEVDPLAGLRVDARLDRAVRQQDGGGVVLKNRRERTDGWLVAGDDGDEARDIVRIQVHVRAVVHELAADERKAHPVGAVQLPVGHAERERRRHEPRREVVDADAF